MRAAALMSEEREYLRRERVLSDTNRERVKG